jgi:hypothetical protein
MRTVITKASNHLLDEQSGRLLGTSTRALVARFPDPGAAALA